MSTSAETPSSQSPALAEVKGDHWIEALEDGTPVLIRPLRPDDREREQAFIQRLSKQSQRNRFLGEVRDPSPALLDQLMLIDHHRTMAFVALAHDDGALREVGISRYGAGKVGDRCECAVAVADDWRQRGLAVILMRHLIAAARKEGFHTLYSVDLAENDDMRALASYLGFTRAPYPDGRHVGDPFPGALMIIYTCYGAARGVTGSCHLVQCGETRILIDCGMFQGDRDASAANAKGFLFDPHSIDAVLLTHAHLDHCGRLPKLVRDGFRGSVVTTSASRDLARIVLMDAAALQEEEARRAAARGVVHAIPASTIEDAFRAMEAFDRVVDYDESCEIAPGVRATFLDAGHILGSASILLELDDGVTQRRMVFSGDLGHRGSGILRTLAPAPEADVVVMETTYGDRSHRNFAASRAEFLGAVDNTLRGHGNVIIPTFALERAQDILYCLHQAMRGGTLPAGTLVFLDSPMAISATDVFRRHPEALSDSFRSLLVRENPFATPQLHFARTVDESMAINRIEGGAIILAGSGMCTGGRVRHHLRHNLDRGRAGIVFVCYAVEGTLARQIIDGHKLVRIGREDIPVRSHVWTINGFSAHADQSELLAWLGGSPRRQILLVHGEEHLGMAVMEQRLRARGVPVVCPRADSPCRLG